MQCESVLRKSSIQSSSLVEVNSTCAPPSQTGQRQYGMTCAEQQHFSLSCHKARGMWGFGFRLFVSVHIVRVKL